MASDGFHLLPLQPKGKEPEFSLLLGNSTKPYQEHRAGPEVVKSWLDSKKDINIGCFAGTEIDKDYRLIIVDLDQEQPKDLGFPLTPIVKTNRGHHLYFKCHKNKIPAAHKGPRGEIKTNGYVVAPPSLHPSGSYYQWIEYLSFKDVPLADFDTRRDQIINYLESGEYKNEEENKVKKNRTDTESNTTINIYSSIKSTCPVNITLDNGNNKDTLIELSKNEDLSLYIMNNVFGVSVNKIGSSFICPLHPESKPSASLFRAANGNIGMKDFHRNGKFYTLAELYFEYKNKKQKDLDSGTFIIWWCRLLRDSGAIKVPKILPPKPLADLSKNQRIIYESFIELLEVQQVYNTKQRPAPFSYRFAADWSGLSLASAQSAIKGLVKKGYLFRAEKGDRDKRKAAKWSIYEKDKLDPEK